MIVGLDEAAPLVQTPRAVVAVRVPEPDPAPALFACAGDRPLDEHAPDPAAAELGRGPHAEQLDRVVVGEARADDAGRFAVDRRVRHARGAFAPRCLVELELTRVRRSERLRVLGQRAQSQRAQQLPVVGRERADTSTSARRRTLRLRFRARRRAARTSRPR